MRLRAQKKQSGFGGCIRIGIQRRQRLFALPEGQSCLRDGRHVKLGHRARRVIPLNTLKLLERRILLPQRDGGLRLPVQHVFAQQFFAGGFAQPAHGEVRLVAREIVITERQSRARTGFILGIARGKCGERRVGGRIRPVAKRTATAAPAAFRGDRNSALPSPPPVFWTRHVLRRISRQAIFPALLRFARPPVARQTRRGLRLQPK